MNSIFNYLFIYLMCVCVRERETETERDRQRERQREREREYLCAQWSADDNPVESVSVFSFYL